MSCYCYHWHTNLGHMNFASIQSMAHKNLGIPQALARCIPPVCQETFFGKAKFSHTTKPMPHSSMTFTARRNVLHWSNDCRLSWSALHNVWSPITTFFVDVATWHIFPHFQESINAVKTLQGKHHYKQYCLCYNCTIWEILIQQWLRWLTVHWRPLPSRTMPNSNRNWHSPNEWNCWMQHRLHLHLDPNHALHAQACWPQVINKEFWPFACHTSCCQHICQLLPWPKWHCYTPNWRIHQCCSFVMSHWSSPMGLSCVRLG